MRESVNETYKINLFLNLYPLFSPQHVEPVNTQEEKRRQAGKDAANPGGPPVPGILKPDIGWVGGVIEDPDVLAPAIKTVPCAKVRNTHLFVAEQGELDFQVPGNGGLSLCAIRADDRSKTPDGGLEKQIIIHQQVSTPAHEQAGPDHKDSVLRVLFLHGRFLSRNIEAKGVEATNPGPPDNGKEIGSS
jgi:hypothetical protein